MIRKIVAVDPEEHDVMFVVKELLVDPMFERLALEGKRGQRATLPDYCGRARWIADAGIPGHADGWLSTIEEAAGQKEVEREYLGRGEWKKLAKRMSMLPRKAGFARPPISRRWRTEKALCALSPIRNAPSRGCSLLQRLRRTCAGAHEQDQGERFAGWDEVKEGRSREGALLADFDAGFVEAGRKPVVVVTASDVLGSRAHHPQPMARAWTPAFEHPDVPEPGTIVVHLQRGLAVLEGLQTFDMGKGAAREMVRLEFAGDDAVLVPPADLALVWPYAGEVGKLMLDRADGSTWWGRRGEAEREIQNAAKDLSKHIAKRRRRRAPRLVAPGPAYERFVTRFPYFTTPDQAKAIQDVDDLASGHPMDRVICGDVGFGKTEVALRAAATVALSGKTGRHRGSDNRSGQAARRDLPQTVRSARHRSRKPFAVDVSCGCERDKGGAAPRETEGRGWHAGPRFEGREIRRPWARHHRRGTAFRGCGEGKTI